MDFKEYIIKKKKGKTEILISVLLYIAATVLGFVGMLLFLRIGLSQLSALALFGAYFAAYRISTGMNREFEYIFAGDQISVDVIMNASRRKNLISFNVSEAEIIASAEDASNASYLKKRYDKVIDATSGSHVSVVYFAVINKEKQTLLKFQPPHSALSDLYKYAPSKVKIKQERL